MILSVSRRTDIPNYYSEWFFNRIKEGFLYVRNPMNPRQVSKIHLSPDMVDGIVFWTKNPEPMLRRIGELAAYDYYFQFTLTGYGKDVEPHLPHKKEKMIPVFQRLSKEIGSRRVVWRYDPILFTKTYTPEYHIKAFAQIADALRGYTDQCVISFADVYVKNRKNMEDLGVYEIGEAALRKFAGILSGIAGKNKISVGTCAEKIDLSECGIEHQCCIDKKRMEEIIGMRLEAGKDKNQRLECGCIESVDVGVYNTCQSGCKYCYANDRPGRVLGNDLRYDVRSPLLCGQVTDEDQIHERKMKSLKDGQIRMFED